MRKLLIILSSIAIGFSTAHAQVFILPINTFTAKPVVTTIRPKIVRAPTPVPTPYPNPLDKHIEVDISEQRLTYYEGSLVLGSMLISSAARGYTTPRGWFAVQAKRPSVLYRGFNANGTISYNYPNTKWNLQIIPHYYIHGAYWHNKFGQPMSHGCVNVAYKDMENLYNWADLGTPINIHE